MSRVQEKHLIKKLVTVLTTFMLMTKASKEAVTLECIPYIKYLVQFWKDKTNSV